jgi:hypothetical protein
MLDLHTRNVVNLLFNATDIVTHAAPVAVAVLFGEIWNDLF